MDWWHNSIISVDHSFSTTMMPFPIKRHTMTMSFVHQVCVVPNSNQPYGLIFEWPGWNPELNLDPWKGCIWFLILFFQGGGVKVWLGVMLWRILTLSKTDRDFHFRSRNFVGFLSWRFSQRARIPRRWVISLNRFWSLSLRYLKKFLRCPTSFSRPRREWKSLGCSRKWSVR